LQEIAASVLRPALDSGTLTSGLVEGWRTVAYAVAGVSVAIVLGLPLGVAASGVLARRRAAQVTSSGLIRPVLAALRAVHELVWAWLFVAAFGLSPMAAVLALGIPYAGVLGRIYSELLQDVPEGPLRALRSAGASEWRVFWHARLPLALPDIVSYTFYRLECGVRAAAVMSFVGLGGLGQRIQLSLDDLAFSTAWTYLLFLIGLVGLVDLWSSQVRKHLAL
jgi:phosphonate transport system permease protein